MWKDPEAQIRAAASRAKEALGQLERREDRVLVHFDVDVLDFADFPAADVPHYGGLRFDEALRTFVVSPKMAAARCHGRQAL